MFMNDRKIGSMSIAMEPIVEDGQERRRMTTTTSVALTMMGTTVRQESTTITVLDGTMRPVRQDFTIVSGGSTMRLRATYTPTAVQCVVEAGGSPSRKTVPIPKGAIISADDTLPGYGKQPKVGAVWTVYSLNPLTVSLDKSVVKVEAAVQATLAGAAYDAFRVSASSPLGKATAWQTAEGELLWATLPLGMALYKMPEEAAKQPDSSVPEHSEKAGELGRAPAGKESPEDFAAATAIVPDQAIPEPRKVRKLVVELGGFPNGYTPISDTWQSARKAGTGHGIASAPLRYTFTVRAVPQTAADKQLPVTSKAMRQYTKAAPYLDVDRPEIRTLARRLRDPKGRVLATASRIRAWLYANLRADFGIGVPRSATDVLQRRRGVCRDYATLFAALARAAGIPTRMVSGIVYADGRFYYHAWVECWAGRWVPFDATMGSDFVDATHIKMAQGDPTDMMQVYRVVGKLSARVLSVSR
jgi:transglutaminase/protease-like cytokinesis protein 3